MSPSHCVGDHPSVLAAIHDPRINVVVWRRELPSEVRDALRPRATPASVEGVLDLDRPHPTAPLASLFPDAARAWLQADTAELAASFGACVLATAIVYAGAYVRSDSCRKLHADHVRLRMLCTYLGPGTEWADDADVDRSALATETADFDAANARIVADPHALRRAATGDVVLLKGERWSGNGGRGAIHRSPPIQAAGLCRLVYKLTLA